MGMGWEEEVGKSVVSYFSISDQKTLVVARVQLLICRQS